jgi:hypothetical protein
MLGETNAKVFADVSFKEGLALVNHRSVVLLGCIQTYRLDYTKFRKYFNSN